MTNSIQIQVESEENIIQLENYPSVYDIVFSDEDNSSVSVNLFGDDITFKIDLKSSDEVDTTIKLADSDAWKYAEECRQIKQDIEHVIDNIQADGDIKIDKDNLNLTISTKSYKHIQTTPTNVWHINHNLDKHCPRVTIVDSEGREYHPAVQHIDENNCIVTLLGSMSGTAYLD